jgi:hypothetical protein
VTAIPAALIIQRDEEEIRGLEIFQNSLTESRGTEAWKLACRRCRRDGGAIRSVFLPLCSLFYTILLSRVVRRKFLDKRNDCLTLFVSQVIEGHIILLLTQR